MLSEYWKLAKLNMEIELIIRLVNLLDVNRC